MKNLVIKLLIPLTLVLSCNIFDKDDDMPNAEIAVEVGEKTDEKIEDLYKGEGSVSLKLGSRQLGVRNYQQVLKTMSHLTTIPVDNNNIKNTFNRVSANLATYTNPDKFTPSHQASIYKLAAEFCNEGYRNEKWRAHIYGEIPVQYGDLQLPESRDQVTDHLVKTLWPPAFHPDEVILEYKQMLATLMQDMGTVLIESKPNGNNDERKHAVLVGTCTAVLAAAPVTLY